MAPFLCLLFFFSAWLVSVAAFQPAFFSGTTTVSSSSSSSHYQTPLAPTRRQATAGLGNNEQAQEEEDDSEIQWQLFLKHHALGSWKGVWTSYDYIGNVIDETVASVDLVPSSNKDVVQQTHNIVVGAKRSDCATCFDSSEIKSFPVATYSPGQLRKARLGACGLVNGPTLLKSGAMATELVLRHGDGRVRVTFQHAPVWINKENNNDDSEQQPTGPPDGLKLFRCMISREALRDAPPTAETEAALDISADNPTFFRPVPPFAWHKQWAGTCWTWGPSIGNKGWGIPSLEEGDAWHGMAPVEVWNLRLPGIFVQAPRVITGGTVGLCRLAWLPDEAGQSLLRLEAGVAALEPVIDDEQEDMMIGFYPPSLASLRCDVLSNMGDLEGDPPFLQDRQAGLDKLAQETILEESEQAQADADTATKDEDEDDDKDDSLEEEPRATAPRVQPKPKKVEFRDEDLEPRDLLQL